MYGYIYLRDNEWFRQEGVYKMGIMTNCKDRDGTYTTGEIRRGKFVLVIEIPWEQMRSMDTLLKTKFKYLNTKFDAGTEFYVRDIESLLYTFVSSHVDCRQLSMEEIETMERTEKNAEKGKCEKLIPNTLVGFNTLNVPLEHQQEVVNRTKEFFRIHDIGKVVWPPGTGKARLGLMIAEEMGFKKILIGVPSLHLQVQMVQEIQSYFHFEKILCIGGSSHKNVSDYRFVVTTYHSCDTIQETFDFKIGDEAHHLVGNTTDKGFRAFHKIPSSKSLFMTATEKTIDGEYSMDNEEVFGPYIDKKSVFWAIENEKITDYSVLLLKNTAQEVAGIMQSVHVSASNRELFLSCFMSLKSMEKYTDLTHILLYTNTMNDANLAKQYIDALLKVIPLQIYNNALHSENKGNLQEELILFKTSPRGIISCVYLFGEGFNEPKLNGVCVSGNMESEVRLVQYLLRPNRLEKGNSSKKAYILIPYLDEEWNTQNDKVTTIIRQLRNVDKTVQQKIRVCIPNKKVYPNPTKPYEYDLEEDAIETERVKLRLRHSRTLGSDFSEEEDEYRFYQAMNRGKFQSRQQYLNDPHAITDPDKYFIEKGVWKDWYDFLGVDTTVFFQTKEEWKQFCKGNVTSSVSYDLLCETTVMLPKEPSLFYRDFTNIMNELGLFTRRR